MHGIVQQVGLVSHRSAVALVLIFVAHMAQLTPQA